MASNQESDRALTKQYMPLATAAGIGSMLGSGIIVGLSATITVWQAGLGLTTGQVGIISAGLTFAIAFGSLFAGTITKTFGLIRSFNWINLFYAIGAAICIFANGFGMLLAGVIITGLASGADLPISLTVVSHDAPDETTSANLVSSTQLFWQVGVFASYICSFIVSTMSGAAGARVVFTILAVCAVITWIWRTFSKKFARFHTEGDKLRAAEKAANPNSDAAKVSLKDVLFGSDKKFLKFFAAILIFYVCWNLLANTWGQFQTFTLVQAHASQSFATGAGIVLNVVSLVATMIFTSVAGGKHRNQAFFFGIAVQFFAMIGMAISGSSLWPIVIAIAIYNMGNPIAGEAIYKVWTQESFPVETRSAIQGFINGFSRLCCGLFAFVTPYLVLPSHIRTSMWGFAGIVAVACISGIIMMRLQKHYRVGAAENAREDATNRQ